jgi:hypothetical protein
MFLPYYANQAKRSSSSYGGIDGSTGWGLMETAKAKNYSLISSLAPRHADYLQMDERSRRRHTERLLSGLRRNVSST